MNAVIQPRSHRLLTILLLVFGILATSYALLAMQDLGIAHASAAGFAAPAVDPVTTAQSVTDDGMGLVEQFGPIWGGALLLYGLMGALLKKNDSEHWLAQGRTLAVITGALSVVAAVLAWKFNGAPIGGVIATLVMAVKLVISPSVATKAA